MDELPSICRRAEKLLADVYRGPVRLEVLEQFESSHTVLRCGVHAEAAPGTLILKQRNFDRPSAPQVFDQSQLFRNEWASLDFLASLSGAAALGPRLLASDRAVGLVVLEDLGAAPTVQEVLYGMDRQAAVEALVGMGKTLGRLQRSTHGREAEFAARQASLGVATPVCDSSVDLRAHLDELRACLPALGIAMDARLEGAFQRLESAVHGPGPFRGFVHNDAGPHNFVTAGRVQPLDFEFGGYGLGLLDGVCARLAFPPAFRGRVLPPEVLRQVEAGYRAELAEAVPEALDERLFTEAIAQACAHWAFSKLLGMWEPYLRERLVEGEERDTRGGRAPERAFFRMQVITYQRLAWAALEQFDRLPELREALAQIIARLLRLWPETPLLPAYPAFGGEPWHYP